MAFQYRRRDPITTEKRMNQNAGNYEGALCDGVKLYKIRNGENALRILPATWEKDNGDAPDHYGYDVFLHYNIGPDGQTVICLHKQYGEKCPICEARDKLDRAGDEEGAKELRTQKRVFMWGIDRKEEDKGPQIINLPYTLDQEIAKASQHKRTGTIYIIEDPDEGHDVYFDKDGEKLRTKYTGVVVDGEPSTLGTQRQAEQWLDYIAENPIPNLLNRKTYAQLKRMYAGDDGDEFVDDTLPRTRAYRSDAEAEPEEPRRGRVEVSTGSKVTTIDDARRPRRETIPEDEIPDFDKPREKSERVRVAVNRDSAPAERTRVRPREEPRAEPEPEPARDRTNPRSRAQELHERYNSRR